MAEHEPRLTIGEQLIVRRSADLASTRRRIRLSLLSGTVLGLAVATSGWAHRPWRPLAVIFVLYILVTTVERVTYGRTVLGYKALVQKLQTLARPAGGTAARGPDPS